MSDFNSNAFLSLQPHKPFSVADIVGFGGPIVPENPSGMLPMPSTVGSMGPMSGALGGLMRGTGLGLNKPTFDAALGGIQTLGSLWAANGALKAAKQQLNFSRNMANANLANQTTSYNTAISDRARSRGAVEGQTQAQVDEYITRNSLAKRTV